MVLKRVYIKKKFNIKNIYKKGEYINQFRKNLKRTIVLSFEINFVSESTYKNFEKLFQRVFVNQPNNQLQF